jgi:hypothetical protein
MAISPSDYNNIRDKVVNVMGTGASGYGQSLVSTTATSANVISATLWNGLRTDMIKARQHQTGIDESANLPILTRTTTITEVIRDTFNSYADTIVANNRVIADNQGTVENIITTTAYASTWNTVLYHRVVVTFATANAAKYFFNAGGQIRFKASRLGTAASSKDTEWTNILGDEADGGTNKGMGSISMNYTATTTIAGTNAVGRAGTGSAIGFYDLLTADPGQQIYIVTSDPATGYGINDYNISARIDAAPGSTGRILTFVVQFRDDVAGGTDEAVTGSLKSFVQVFRPSGSNVSVSGPTGTQAGPGLVVLT